MALTVNVDGLHHGWLLGKTKLLLDRASRLGMQAKGRSIAKRYENQGNLHDGDTMHAEAKKCADSPPLVDTSKRKDTPKPAVRIAHTCRHEPGCSDAISVNRKNHFRSSRWQCDSSSTITNKPPQNRAIIGLYPFSSIVLVSFAFDCQRGKKQQRRTQPRRQRRLFFNNRLVPSYFFAL